MELDLDSFLESHGVGNGTDGNDDQSLSSSVPHNHHHRTVDEILLLNDSSSSSSSASSSLAGSPSPPSSPSAAAATLSTWRHRLDYEPSRVDDSDYSINNNNNKTTNNTNNNDFDFSETSTPTRLFNNSSSIISSTTRADFASFRPVLLPPLFTSVKSNFKPGAALAAAAAASRSIPTPHAAAIKSFRTSSTATLSPILDDSKSPAAAPHSHLDSGVLDELPATNAPHSELYSGVSDELDSRVLDEVGGEGVGVGGGVKETDNQVVVKVRVQIDNLSTPHLEAEAAPSSVVSENVDNQSIDDSGCMLSSFPSAATHLDDLHAESEILVDIDGNSSTSKGRQVQSNSGDEDDTNEDSRFNSANEIVEMEITPIVADSDQGELFNEEKTVDIEEMRGQEDVLSEPKDEVLSPRGVDSSSDEDIADIVQDAALRWKNKEDSRMTHKESHQPSLTPLELAEALEKKQAFAGMHWEEGAAAQPMRLEGVRRGSTVLGYFDVDSNNAITRTISSQTFRREHGFPSVLSVHLNSVAIGMSKGVIIIMPSKYSPYHSDNMDAKV